LYLWDCQRQRRWQPRAQGTARAIGVGIMGLGNLGRDAASALMHLGFRVSGWSASPKAIDGIESFHGSDGLEPFLKRTNILVCLLPLTPDTKHLLNRRTLSLLDSTSPLGAPVLINAGRGGLQNEADILACLNDGTLGAASLDVFETEPLPAESPLWQQPNVIVTPHNAADTDPEEISKYVAVQIERFEAGGALENVVDLGRGY
jgi:glyoxylate/hydroxypyruvate reductase A